MVVRKLKLNNGKKVVFSGNNFKMNLYNFDREEHTKLTKLISSSVVLILTSILIYSVSFSLSNKYDLEPNLFFKPVPNSRDEITALGSFLVISYLIAFIWMVVPMFFFMITFSGEDKYIKKVVLDYKDSEILKSLDNRKQYGTKGGADFQESLFRFVKAAENNELVKVVEHCLKLQEKQALAGKIVRVLNEKIEIDELRKDLDSKLNVVRTELCELDKLTTEYYKMVVAVKENEEKRKVSKDVIDLLAA